MIFERINPQQPDDRIQRHHFGIWVAAIKSFVLAASIATLILAVGASELMAALVAMSCSIGQF